MPLLLRMAVHSRTHPRALAHAVLWLFGWVARSEGVQTIASLVAIGPIRRLSAPVLVIFACMVRGPAQIGHTPTCVQAGPLVALTHGQRGDGRPRREAIEQSSQS